MPEPDTTIDWSGKIALIRRRFEESVRAGESLSGWDVWLQQVPEAFRGMLRKELDLCRLQINESAIATRVYSSVFCLDGSSMQDNSDLVDDVLVAVIRRDRMPSSAVADCKAFAGLSVEAREALQSSLVEKSFPYGSLLLNQGQQASGLHLVLSGLVDIVDVATGRRIDVDGPGSVLGEMSLLTDQPCSANVVATNDVTTLTLSADDYHRLKLIHPELEIALSQLVNDRLGGRNHDALCGKTIGDYELVRCINRGGMGVVYEGRHCKTNDTVALKMLRHRFIYDDAMQSRFDQEAAMLEQLRHENVVSFRQHFLACRTRFLVMDLCNGADLFQLLRKNSRLDEVTTRSILGQIARGLQYAHQCGVIHRDLKPGNVLVGRDGCVKLADFGLSKLIESEVTDGKAVGTPSYMPPEQFRSGDVGPTCDWYAMGCLACEMLTGRILFRGLDWRELFEQKLIRKPSKTWPALDASNELRQVIADVLAPTPEARRIDLDQIASWADKQQVRSIRGLN